MPKTNEKVIAILCADIHLSHKPPIWRSAEPNWYKAMARSLGELTKLQAEYKCPVLCMGDIFDKWNSPPELINFAMNHLPHNMFSIPGQHDLPNHNYNERERSAYWTLFKAGKIINLNFNFNNYVLCEESLHLYGFPFGTVVKPIISNVPKFGLKIALIHKYLWIADHSYPGAPQESKLSSKLSKLGYDVLVYGDNHKGFMVSTPKTTVFNCGTLMRRESDEVDYKPQIGLLYESGKIKPHFLDTSQDRYIESTENITPTEEMNMEELIEELKKLGETGLDFVTAVERFFKKHKTKRGHTKYNQERNGRVNE